MLQYLCTQALQTLAGAIVIVPLHSLIICATTIKAAATGVHIRFQAGSNPLFMQCTRNAHKDQCTQEWQYAILLQIVDLIIGDA